MVVAVDRFQKKQTLGYWIGAGDPYGAKDLISAYAWSDLGWSLRDQYPDPAYRAVALQRSIAQDCVLLCAFNELDGPEENEFGIVTP